MERAATVVAVVARVAAIDKITNLGVGSRLRELSQSPLGVLKGTLHPSGRLQPRR